MALFINGVGQDSFSMNGVSVDNLYVDSVLVWSKTTGEPPIYELTEPLVTPGDGFSYLLNSASSGLRFNGKLLTSTDTAWTPTAQEYPGDETAVIDFGTNKMDTQWAPPENTVYTFTFIYDVDMGNSYKMCSLVPRNDHIFADVYYDGVLAPRDTRLAYSSPLAPNTIEIDENSIYTLIPKIPICTIVMSQYAFSAGDTATVTYTWDTVVPDFTLSNGVHAQNGVIINLIQDPDRPWIYTATFTPDADVNDDTNILVVNGTTFNIHDQWGNGTDAQYESANYTVNTGAVEYPIHYVSFNSSSATPVAPPVGVTVNDFDNTEDNSTGYTILDADGVDNGVRLDIPFTVSGSTDGNENCGLLIPRIMDHYFYGGASVGMDFPMYMPDAGTWRIETTLAKSGSATDTVEIFTIRGDEQIIDSSNNTTDVASWDIVTTSANEEILLETINQATTSNGAVPGMTIQRIA